MQTGVKYEMDLAQVLAVAGDPVGHDGTSPKHLRVGINSALVSHAALVKLLIEKGILTEGEYVASQADAMETEVALYEERANRGNNGPVLHFG